ncbi:hypothetical protein [Glycomyces sp. NRRL B-16210]|uniref:hypothetical protein n=1 Tax=Glycomyces sp. NRRL B-16210 TaxID=1463821 RepID=UPI0004BF7073|nr:hypothetical protein [Glycomyces sp. NRRL B-16210]
MERTPSTWSSRAGGLAALGGSILVVASMFLPWVYRGGAGVDYLHLTAVEAVRADRAYGVSVALVPLLAVWCALFFVWRRHETRMVWAFGGLAGAMLLYGGDLRLSADLPVNAAGIGEPVAVAGLLVLAAGCVLALAANIAEPRALSAA